MKEYGVLFLAIPLVSYVLQGAFVYAAEGRWGMAWAMIAYAQANVGLILDMYGY